MSCEYELKIQELREASSQIKQNPEYQKLIVKHDRNPTEQKRLDAFRRQLADFERQIADHNAAIEAQRNAKPDCEPQSVSWRIPKNTAARHEMAQKKANVFNSNQHAIIKTSGVRMKEPVNTEGVDEFMGW
jgi:hypothetical protein